MRVLRHAHRLCKPGGVLLDLTTVPPAASIEAGGTVLGRLEQTAFLERAAIDRGPRSTAWWSQGLLVEESVLSLDVLKHFDSGADAIADLAVRPRDEAPGRATSGPRDRHVTRGRAGLVPASPAASGVSATVDGRGVSPSTHP